MWGLLFKDSPPVIKSSRCSHPCVGPSFGVGPNIRSWSIEYGRTDSVKLLRQGIKNLATSTWEHLLFGQSFLLYREKPRTHGKAMGRLSSWLKASIDINCQPPEPVFPAIWGNWAFNDSSPAPVTVCMGIRRELNQGYQQNHERYKYMYVYIDVLSNCVSEWFLYNHK